MSRELPWRWSIFAASRNGPRPIEPTAAPAPAPAPAPALALESDNQPSPVRSPSGVHACGPQPQFSLAETAQPRSLPLPVHISTARKETSCGGRSRKASLPAGEAPKNKVGAASVMAPQAQTESEQLKRYVRLRIKMVPDQGEEKKEPGKVKNQHKVPDQMEEEQEAKKNGVKKHKVGEVRKIEKNGKEKHKVPEEEQPRKIRKQVAENEVINNDITPISKNLKSRNKLPQKKQKEREIGSTSSGPKGGLKGVVKTNDFSLSLSAKEIQEDFLFMTGRLPPRKPKKRTKAVQVDTLYPGSELNFVCEQIYAVEEKPARKPKRLRFK